MFNAEFYPTPLKVIDKMLSGIKLDEIATVLEPSAGKGDIVDAIIEKFNSSVRYWRKNDLPDIDTVELDENLRHILKGKGYRVIHDDFLSLHTFKSYDLIIMNPPFSNGDKHLLKALEMQHNGGQIVCLLNAETIRNPFSNTRKDIVQRLEEYEAEITYMDGAFADAERKTGVEVALIKVNIPAKIRSSIILDGLKKDEVHRFTAEATKDVVQGDFLERIVEQYNFEVRAGLKLINEYFSMKPLIMNSRKKHSSPIITMSIDKISDNASSMANAYIEKVRYRYWETLFQSDMFANLFTSGLQHQYIEKIRELQGYDFSLYNIYQIRLEVFNAMAKSVEQTILDLFEEFSHKHHWYDETSKNIHYYNGWKTNKAWIINKKVIIKLNGFNSWSGGLNYHNDVERKLMDIEKVFNYLDGGQTDHVELKEVLQQAEKDLETRKIQLKYFTVTFYKKGTCHIEFTNLDLLKKFNVFGSQRKGWLPPSYGKVRYKEMSREEKAVIDEFEGEKEYDKTMANTDYYLYNPSGLQKLLA